MFAYGAAAALLISFAGLAVFWRTTRLEGGTAGRVILEPGRLTRTLFIEGRIIGLALYVLLVGAAVFGDSDTVENIAPVFVYVVFWVGMTLVCALIGNLWWVVNPFDTLAALVEGLRGGPRPPAPYRWGRWPAVAALAGFVWLELVPSNRAQPRTLAVAVIAYTVVVLVATARWGRAWLRQGEGFTVFFGVLAHMAPVYADDEGRIRARPPLSGLVGLRPDAATQAVVIIALGSTSFDGLSRSRFWIDLTRNLGSTETALLATAGLVWAISVVTLAFVGAMRITGRLHKRRHPELTAAFVHSLVPIAFAYALAHYFSLLVFEGQSAIALASDPLGRGWDLFGTAGDAVNFTLVSTTTIAYVQASGILAGHVAGVVVAHDRALALFPHREATRSQYPLLAAMVLFTVGGLALLLGA
ncbi:MAG: hypothetical protein AVDCRST_MAG10-1910 [uncultured Acidimicrobiales bacterium]|uniref:Fenitrothion hydrolase n=1 Tax=uncultured Acidimicrobiales bacterium TaxID=310071 RepID=A0A6J4I9B2_9ACTN|nr:MAG: hypothetical protein AVDCRST_MAG10-1910 [uncultured Acidimicrobiales bacterium]